jgi:uncharacterized membrane protein YcaP (DUF421 family)
MLTQDAIMSQLRLQGIKSIEDVKEAYVEPSGEISAVPREEPGGGRGEGKKRRQGL